jgi:hypothetical protein
LTLGFDKEIVMRYAIIATALFVSQVIAGCSSARQASHGSSSGQVLPEMSAQTADLIAQAIGRQHYGDAILTQQPFIVRRDGKTWVVEGRMAQDKLGGVLRVEIDATSYCVVSVSHGK